MRAAGGLRIEGRVSARVRVGYHGLRSLGGPMSPLTTAVASPATAGRPLDALSARATTRDRAGAGRLRLRADRPPSYPLAPTARWKWYALIRMPALK